MPSNGTANAVCDITTCSSKSTATPLLIFVLGAPCAGKSTVCKLLAARYNLDHFSVGDELRSLVSESPSDPVARIMSKFSASELEVFAQNVKAGTLAPTNQTPKYVKERVFPEEMNPNDVRILIDGFPRGVDRWEAFKESVKDKWQPDARTWAVIINVDEDVARERSTSRGRAGDVFEKRFDFHVQSIGPTLRTMRFDNVRVVEYTSDQECDPNTICKLLGEIPAWIEDVELLQED